MARPVPKTPAKKKRRSHPKSIMYQLPGTCYLCVHLNNDITCKRGLHKHHIYDGPNRKISEENGFTVKLCPYHHEFSPAAVHVNVTYMRYLQEACQREYEKTHTREEFMALIGRNYIAEE